MYLLVCNLVRRHPFNGFLYGHTEIFFNIPVCMQQLVWVPDILAFHYYLDIGKDRMKSE
jgi:hypothetical protein